MTTTRTDTGWREAIDDLVLAINKEPCPSCDRGHTFPGMGRHRCYTYAEQAAWSAPPRVTRAHP